MSVPEYRSPHYTLVDNETHNLIGVYRSRVAALRDVADTVRCYGLNSRAVRTLSLARDDVPDERGFIAVGRALGELALEKCGSVVKRDGNGSHARMGKMAASARADCAGSHDAVAGPRRSRTSPWRT